MRIGIDARFLGPQGSGISRYIERLIAHLERIDHRHEYVVWLRSAARWRPTNPRWSVRIADVPWYSLAEQTRMPGIFRAAKLDLLHVPHFNVPLLYTGKMVVTIHDLILNEHPTERASTLEPLIFRLKHAAYQFTIRRAVDHASRIITVSRWSESQLHAAYPSTKQKTRVTYEAADPLPTPVDPSTLTTHGVKPPYLLYAGNTYPHKNLENLVEAIRIMRRTGETIQLVLVGKRDYFSERLEKLVRDTQVNNVVFFGYATDAELNSLYRHATAYVFPSLSEGFGLPGLEAMQAQTPVVAADASCLPEIYGPTAEYFNPKDPADMAARITTVIHDPKVRERLITAGAAKVQEYSWERMARETLSIYEEAKTA